MPGRLRSSHLIFLAIGAAAGFAGARYHGPDPTFHPRKSETLSRASADFFSPSPARGSDRPAGNAADDSVSSASSVATIPAEAFDHALYANDFARARELLLDQERRAGRIPAFLEENARLLVRERKWDDARPALAECLTANPRSMPCLLDRSTVEIINGTVEDKVRAATDCLRVDPHEAACWNNAAMARMSQGRFDDAIDIYERLLRENGNYGTRFEPSHLHWQLGVALEGARRFPEAIANYRMACNDDYAEACRKVEDLGLRVRD